MEENEELESNEAFETAVKEKMRAIESPPFDYSGKIRLSANEMDAVSKDKAIELINNSDINLGYRKQMLEEIDGMNADSVLTYKFAESIRRMFSADAQHGAYRAGSDGL